MRLIILSMRCEAELFHIPPFFYLLACALQKEAIYNWAPRKIAVGQKSATGRSCSANESHTLVSVHNWIFRGAQ